MIRRIPIFATLVVLVAVGIMIRLGFWQIDRLHQKEALIARYHAAQADQGFSAIWPDLPEAAYMRVQEYCRKTSRWSAVSGRNAQGEAGWAHVVRCEIGGPWPDTPPDMRTTDNVIRPADVVIGWSRSPHEIQWKGGVLAGTVVPSGDLGFHIVADPPLAGLQANAKPDPNDIPNNHFAYAVQWFLFAASALVIYAIALRKRLRGGGDRPPSLCRGGLPAPRHPANRAHMEYISTRGSAPALDFENVTLAGLASDGGLYLPREWPRFSAAEIAGLAGLPYAELAARVMQPFVGNSLTPEKLLELCERAYGRFSHEAVTPLVQLDQRHWLLELFHGPTLAFKDVALQLLGLLFEEFLSRRDDRLTIVGATSGDTGSAAIDAVAGRAGIDIFMLHPRGRVSDVQRRQMTTVLAPNVHNIAIEGSFDDAQAMVKRMFNDSAMTGRFNIGAVNSINWARLMAQVVYYFAVGVQLGAPHRRIAFSVPTGNFGDVFAGYVAQKMGLPVERLIVATNVNDILHRALSDGDYSQGAVTPTAAPSMDIQVSSNFERLLFDAGGRDGAAMAAQMHGFEVTKAMRLTNAQRQSAAAIFSSARADAAAMSAAMRWASDQCGEVIDPHTAIGLHAARASGIAADVPVVTLATAHPAKFPDAVEAATGVHPALPARVGDLFEREERYAELPGDYDAIAAYVAQHATPSA